MDYKNEKHADVNLYRLEAMNNTLEHVIKSLWRMERQLNQMENRITKLEEQIENENF